MENEPAYPKARIPSVSPFNGKPILNTPAVASAKNPTIAEKLIRGIGCLIARCFYREDAFGLENLPEAGFLILPNHLTWVDAIILQLGCPRPIRFIVWEDIYFLRTLRPIF